MIDAAVLPPLGSSNQMTMIKVRALLDTGATTSGITPPLADALTLPSLGKKPVQTAGGLVQMDRFAFRIGFYDTLKGGDISYPHVLDKEVYAIGLASTDSFEIIVGMDVIGRNHLELHSDGSTIFRFTTSQDPI